MYYLQRNFQVKINRLLQVTQDYSNQSNTIIKNQVIYKEFKDVSILRVILLDQIY